MAQFPDLTGKQDLKSQIFVLRVYVDHEMSELEHVNAGDVSSHDTLQAAFDEIVKLLDSQAHRTMRARRH